MTRRALITGITGQDGSYLAELLLAKGYDVHGIVRRSSSFNTARIEGIYQDPHQSGARLFLHFGDLHDGTGLRRIIESVEPDEVYHLGAQSHVRVSFDQPEYTADVVAVGSLRLFDSVRDYTARSKRDVRVYQAGSSEMFGATAPPQNEHSPFYPRSPYAVSKVAAHWFAVNYRESYGLFICNGILFNHESPRRGETFVTRKITRAVGRIKMGLQDKLYLGNLDARRDWGFAGDYVDAMWRMLQRDEPDDYVIATGESHSVREFMELAFGSVGLDWRNHVEIDPRYFRPTEVDALQGDPSKATQLLGWTPRVTFEALAEMMVQHDLESAREEAVLSAAQLRQVAPPRYRMDRDAKIYVAGHRGLAGSAIVRRLHAEGHTNLVYRRRDELDLQTAASVHEFFALERPEYVFLAAAKVGGILANNSYPADFITSNLSIQLNVIAAAHTFGVRKLLFLGSSCIYPKHAPQPIKEEYLLTGPLEPTNEPYAIAKIAGIKLCEAYNRQFGTNYISAMPTNLYGPGDNFDLSTSHVLPALVRKFHEAKVRGEPAVVVWGTGSPRREFLHVDDMASACVRLMWIYDSSEIVNVGCGEDVSIREVAELIRETVGYPGEIVYDASKPDGTPRKLLDIQRLRGLGWAPSISLSEGLRRFYGDYLALGQ